MLQPRGCYKPGCVGLSSGLFPEQFLSPAQLVRGADDQVRGAADQSEVQVTGSEVLMTLSEVQVTRSEVQVTGQRRR